MTGGTPFSLAVDAASVYWADGAFVKKVPIAGGDPVQLSTLPQDRVYGIVVDASHIYWSSYGEGTITRSNLDGSEPKVVASGQRQPYTMADDEIARGHVGAGSSLSSRARCIVTGGRLAKSGGSRGDTAEREQSA